MTTTTQPRWRPAPRAHRLATVAAFALALAFLTGHGALLALAAGPLVLLALGGLSTPPGNLTVTATLETTRCVEGDPVTLTVTVHANPPLDAVSARVLGPASVASTPMRGTGTTLTGGITPARWGVLGLRLRLHTLAGHLLWHADIELRLPDLTVLPRAPRLRTTPAPPALLARLGEHPARSTGSGIEFAGIRDYTPGDVLRDLNWSATSRRRRPLVNERAGERAADLIVAIDAFTDLDTDGQSTVDAAVRGATALAQTALRQRDRVGLIVLGGVLRWLTPAGGARQLYRIAETVLAARSLMESVVRPDVTRLPRPALPPGALVVVFSPLVDQRAFAVLRDLRQRRVPTVVVDVLGQPTPPHRGPGRSRGRAATDPLTLRVWRLDRAADRWELARLGIPVLHWPPERDLQAVFAPLARHRSGRPA